MIHPRCVRCCVAYMPPYTHRQRCIKEDKIFPNTDNFLYLQFYIFTILYLLKILLYRITTRSRCILTPCRRATQKCVISVPCVVDGSRISAFLYATSCTCVCHLVWLTYRFQVIASLMQDVWVSSYKQTDRY